MTGARDPGIMENPSSPTVLIVDDEEPIRTLLTRLLAQEGYDALTARDVQQALAALEERQVDLILLDLHMPGPYDGEELLFLLRDRGDEVPIVIVSGWVDDDAAVAHPECVHGILKKPIQKDSLLAMVRSALA